MIRQEDKIEKQSSRGMVAFVCAGKLKRRAGRFRAESD